MELKAMREKAGLKQSELAQISGVNLRSLQDYEQGHKSLYSAKGETLLRLSIVLGYSVEEILKGAVVEIDPIEENLDSLREARLIAYVNSYVNRAEHEAHFPVICHDEIVDMSRIYPTKQELVKNVLSNIRSDGRVDSLRLFGSSITMACNRESDVDFAVGLKDTSMDARNEISEKIQTACNWEADIIWLDHLSPSDRILPNIMKGLVLI